MWLLVRELGIGNVNIKQAEKFKYMGSDIGGWKT